MSLLFRSTRDRADGKRQEHECMSESVANRQTNLPQCTRIRLDQGSYQSPGTCAPVTIASANRHPVFVNPAFTEACVAILREQAERNEIEIPAYCYMPDHPHLLVQVSRYKDLIGIVDAFKGHTTRLAWRHGLSGRLWQWSFYDHVLPEDEDPMVRIRYILGNPVRRGLNTRSAARSSKTRTVRSPGDEDFGRGLSPPAVLSPSRRHAFSLLFVNPPRVRRLALPSHRSEPGPLAARPARNAEGMSTNYRARLDRAGYRSGQHAARSTPTGFPRTPGH